MKTTTTVITSNWITEDKKTASILSNSHLIQTRYITAINKILLKNDNGINKEIDSDNDSIQEFFLRNYNIIRDFLKVIRAITYKEVKKTQNNPQLGSLFTALLEVIIRYNIVRKRPLEYRELDTIALNVLKILNLTYLDVYGLELPLPNHIREEMNSFETIWDNEILLNDTKPPIVN